MDSKAQVGGRKVVTDMQRRCGVLTQRQKVASCRLEVLEAAVFGPSFLLKRKRAIAVARQAAEQAKARAAAGGSRTLYLIW